MRSGGAGVQNILRGVPGLPMLQGILYIYNITILYLPAKLRILIITYK